MKNKQKTSGRGREFLSKYPALCRGFGELLAAAAIVVVSAAIGFAGEVFAWGPADRPTYTMESPATSPVFNSITNNSRIGDERNFVRVRELGMGNFVDNVKVEPGKKYEVYVFYHNNAAANFNLDSTASGIARNVRMHSSFPKSLSSGETGTIVGELTSGTKNGDAWTNSNVNPPRVWDEAFLIADTDMTLHYVSGSAVIYNQGRTNGKILSENLFSTTGTFIGFNNLDGLLPGCNEYSGYVIYQIETEKAEFRMTKQVRLGNDGEFSDSVAAMPDDEVEFRLVYENIGTTNQYNVVIEDQLPDYLAYASGSVRLYNDTYPDGQPISDAIFHNGGNIGNYGPGAKATITYRATVNPADDFACDWTNLDNSALAHTGDGNKTDTARVRVYKNCEKTPEEPEIPPTLPTTGPVEVVGILVGTTMLVIAVVYYVRSRQTMNKTI
jgi:uncharacterized repeat protein (TIGR01451 family)